MPDVLPGSRSSVCAASLARSRLCVRRRDIEFRNVSPERVRIRVTVRNAGSEPSGPSLVILRSAPFGAFLPWRPLTSLTLPAIEPGGAVTVETEAVRSRVAPLGRLDDVPPARLLTALGLTDGNSGDGLSGTAAETLDRSWLGRTGRAVLPRLALDPGDLLGRGGEHWAGNVNVFVHERPVERHLARAIRIYPGCVNRAFFIVGTGSSLEEYAFHLAGEGIAWDPELEIHATVVSMAQLLGRGPLSGGIRIVPGEWIRIPGIPLILLTVRPPETARRGTLEVQVTQRSSERTAVVEFDLDADAVGPGCYVV